MKRLLLSLALLLVAVPAFAQDGPKVHARLVAEDKAVAPGGTITIASDPAKIPLTGKITTAFPASVGGSCNGSSKYSTKA